MRKNLNKLIAFGIGLSVISSSIVPALGAEIKSNVVSSQVGTTVNAVKTLSLQEVIDAAINKDDQIKIYNSQISYYKGMQDYYDEVDDDNGDDENDINMKSARQSIEFRKDAIEYEMRELYNNIIITQKQIELQEAVVSNATVETDNVKLKAQQGLKIQTEVETQDQSLQAEKDKLGNYKSQLNDFKKKLTVLSGINTTNCVFDDTLQFKPFRVDGNLDEYIDNNIDIITQYSKELVDLYKDEVEDMKDDKYDDLDDLLPDKNSSKYNTTISDELGNTTNVFDVSKYQQDYQAALTNYRTYLSTKMSSNIKDAQLDIQKKTYKNSLTSTYTSIINQENAINQVIAKIKTTNKNLANIKLQYNLGLMTTNDYNKAVAGYRQLDIQLRQQVNGYYQTVIAFEKPWAASSASAAASSQR